MREPTLAERLERAEKFVRDRAKKCPECRGHGGLVNDWGDSCACPACGGSGMTAAGREALADIRAAEAERDALREILGHVKEWAESGPPANWEELFAILNDKKPEEWTPTPGWIDENMRKLKIAIARKAKKDWDESPQWAKDEVLRDGKEG